MNTLHDQFHANRTFERFCTLRHQVELCHVTLLVNLNFFWTGGGGGVRRGSFGIVYAAREGWKVSNR